MAQHQIRLNPPALPEFDQGTFQRKVDRLSTRVRVDQVIVIRGRGWIKEFDQRASQHFLRHDVTPFDHAAEDRVRFVQPAPHAQILRALPRKEEGDARSFLGGHPADNSRRAAPVGNSSKFRQQLGPIRSHNRQPLVELAASHRRRITEISQIHHRLGL